MPAEDEDVDLNTPKGQDDKDCLTAAAGDSANENPCHAHVSRSLILASGFSACLAAAFHTLGWSSNKLLGFAHERCCANRSKWPCLCAIHI